MAIIQNPWVGYLTRSYLQVKQALVTALTVSNPEITDFSESNPLVIIISMFSGVAEMLNYYIDIMARESFLMTCQLYASAVKHVKVLDYRIKASIAATVDLYFSFLDLNGTPVELLAPYTIAAGTIVETAAGNQFVVLNDIVIPIGATFGTGSAAQWVKETNVSLGITNNQPNQLFYIPANYANASMNITINGILWNLQDTLALSLPGDNDYIIDIDEDQNPYVKFGTGVKGAIPPANQQIIAEFYTTDGKSSNDISANTINILSNDLPLPNGVSSITVTNNLNPSGGNDIESISDIQINAPLSIRTLNRAVTTQDYRDILRLSPGVAKASVVFVCGKTIPIYVAPVGGGIGSSQLLVDTFNFLGQYKMVGTTPQILAAGETPIVVQGNILARYRVDPVQTLADCINALVTLGSFDNNYINGRIGLSDVIGALDQLPKVDIVNITGFYTMPYAFPLNSTTPLDWIRQTLVTCQNKSLWRLVYTGTFFRVFKNGGQVGTVNINAQFVDPFGDFSFRINAGFYTIGMIWSFTVYPYNATISIDDNTIPTITADTINLQVIPQFTPPQQNF